MLMLIDMCPSLNTTVTVRLRARYEMEKYSTQSTIELQND